MEAVRPDETPGSLDSRTPMNDQPTDITEDEEYAKFVESMVPHCHCAPEYRPCDGVLAGGLCDNVQCEHCSDDDQE